MALNDLLQNRFARIAGTLAALAVPMGLACEADEGSPVYPQNSQPTSQPCYSDSECKGERICVNGYCQDAAVSGQNGNTNTNEGCGIKETTGCENFTGVYKITDFERAVQCSSGDIDTDVMSFITYSDCTVALSNGDDCLFACHDYTAKGNHLIVPLYDKEFVKCGNTIKMSSGGCSFDLVFYSSNPPEPDCRCN